jgi:hypothetical protein
MQSSCDISRLRVLVGYLGERHQSNWWSSTFLGRTSEAFLAPIFGNAVANARVVGVTEAARRVHDDAIGVGRTFHLFRLPETLEQELHRTLSASKDTATPESVDAAIEDMKALSSRDSAPKLGPVHVGALNMLANAQWIPVVASHYRAAFAAGVQSFPYFAG